MKTKEMRTIEEGDRINGDMAATQSNGKSKGSVADEEVVPAGSGVVERP